MGNSRHNFLSSPRLGPAAVYKGIYNVTWLFQPVLLSQLHTPCWSRDSRIWGHLNQRAATKQRRNGASPSVPRCLSPSPASGPRYPRAVLKSPTTLVVLHLPCSKDSRVCSKIVLTPLLTLLFFNHSLIAGNLRSKTVWWNHLTLGCSES